MDLLGRKHAAAKGSRAAGQRVRVLLPLPLGEAFDYRVPPGLSAGPGDFVQVPLGVRETIGVVWDGAGDRDVAPARLRDVIEVLDVPPMTESLRRFVDWVASYTLNPPGAVLRMAMSVPSALEPPTPQAGWKLAPLPVEGVRMTPERERVLALLKGGVVRSGGSLADEAHVTMGVVRGLADAGLIVPALLPRGTEFTAPDPDRPGPALSPEQAAAATALFGWFAAEPPAVRRPLSGPSERTPAPQLARE